MGLLGSMTLSSMDDLFMEQLQTLYDAERRITKGLQEMTAAAHDSALTSAFEEHLGQTGNHVKRLEQVFTHLGKPVEAKTCEAMKGLIEEGSQVVKADGDPHVKDAALIAAAQRVEHYEIAAYGTARTLARQLGQAEAARLLQETLNEEAETDKKLTALAESLINPKARESKQISD